MSSNGQNDEPCLVKGTSATLPSRCSPPLVLSPWFEPLSSRSAGPASLPLVVAFTTGPVFQGNNVVYAVR